MLEFVGDKLNSQLGGGKGTDAGEGEGTDSEAGETGDGIDDSG